VEAEIGAEPVDHSRLDHLVLRSGNARFRRIACDGDRQRENRGRGETVDMRLFTAEPWWLKNDDATRLMLNFKLIFYQIFP